MPRIDQPRLAIFLLATMLASIVLFRSAPQIDIRVSALFFDAGRGGFWAADTAPMRLARNIVWDLSLAMILAAFLGMLWPYLGVPRRVWGFIATLYLLGPGALVNLLLKEHWGRARPAQIVEFGGTAQFTPAGTIADQCATNCSFVSGEVASAAAFSLSALLLLWCWRARLSRAARQTGAILAMAVTLAAAVQRVAAGRHFASDAVFAVLFVYAVALVLSRVFAPRS